MTVRMAWLPWVVDDWLTSPTRLRMNPTERSIYHDLLAYQWKDGYLPSDHESLARMAAVSPEVFAAAAPIVLRQFNLRNGRLKNRKLDLLRASATSRCTEQARKSQKGGQAKARKMKEVCTTGTPQAEVRHEIACVSVSNLPGFSVNCTGSPRAGETAANRNGTTTYGLDLAEGAKRIWDQYPGVQTEDDLRLVMSLCSDHEKLARMSGSLAAWRRSGRWRDARYIPKMRNWLNNGECWIIPPILDDEAESPKMLMA